MRLASRNPEVEPDVMFNLLGDERDLRRMRDAVRYMLTPLRPSRRASGRRRAVPDRLHRTIQTAWRRSTAATRDHDRLGTAAGRPAGVRDRLLAKVITDGRAIDEILHDDAALDDYLRSTVTGIWHATGTCRMGNPTIPRPSATARAA